MCFKCSFILLIIHVLFSICTYFFLKFFMPLPRSKNTWGRCGGPGPSHVICIYIAYCSYYVGVYCTPYILSGGLEYIISLLQTLVLTGTGFVSSYSGDPRTWIRDNVPHGTCHADNLTSKNSAQSISIDIFLVPVLL